MARYGNDYRHGARGGDWMGESRYGADYEGGRGRNPRGMRYDAGFDREFGPGPEPGGARRARSFGGRPGRYGGYGGSGTRDFGPRDFGMQGERGRSRGFDAERFGYGGRREFEGVRGGSPARSPRSERPRSEGGPRPRDQGPGRGGYDRVLRGEERFSYGPHYGDRWESIQPEDIAQRNFDNR